MCSKSVVPRGLAQIFRPFCRIFYLGGFNRAKFKNGVHNCNGRSSLWGKGRSNLTNESWVNPPTHVPANSNQDDRTLMKISRWQCQDRTWLWSSQTHVLFIYATLYTLQSARSVDGWVGQSFEACKLILKRNFFLQFSAQGVSLVGNLINQMWTNSSFEMAKLMQICIHFRLFVKRRAVP